MKTRLLRIQNQLAPADDEAVVVRIPHDDVFRHQCDPESYIERTWCGGQFIGEKVHYVPLKQAESEVNS